MSYLKLADTLVIPFSTCNSSGALTNADALPVVVVRDNGTDMGYAPTVTSISAGRYEVTIIGSGANGFTVGHHYSVWVYTNMNTVSIGDGIGSFNVKATDSDDLALASALATVQSDTDDIQVRLPSALVGGKMDSTETVLEGRLTSTRAGYLDNLSAGAVALASALATAEADITTLLGRLTALRAGYLDNLSAGAVAQASALSTAQTAITDIQTDVDEIQTQITTNDALIIAAVSNIAVTGAALNAIASSRVITTGTETGTLADSNTADGVYHNIADVAGTIDFYDEFDVSATSGAVAVGVQWLGYVVGLVNTVKVYARNWVGAVWDQIGTVVGIAGAVASTEEFELTSAHTQAGLARIRFAATGLTAATVKTDRILLGYAVVAPTVAAIQTGLATAAALATVQADTDDIQTRLPVALVGGKIDSHVNDIAANAITAASIATDAIDADALKSDAVTEIQSGLATAAALATVQSDTDDIQSRLPAALGANGNIKADIRDILGTASATPAVAGIIRVEDAVTQARLTATRAGYLDNLSAGAVALASALATAESDITLLLSRLTALRAGYLDNLSAGAVAQASALATVQSDTDDIQSRLPAALVGGKMDSHINDIAANAITAASIATDAIDADALKSDAVTEIQTGLATAAALSTAQVAISDIQTDVDELQTSVASIAVSVIRSGTAQGAGAGNNQIQLDAGASATNDLYQQSLITILSGLGAGQTRLILKYIGSTKIATVNHDWAINPNATSVFQISAFSNTILQDGLAQSSAAGSITLQSTEPNTTDFWKGVWLHIVSGTGAGQARLITGYNGTTKVALITPNWAVNPDSTSGYSILTGAEVEGVAAIKSDTANIVSVATSIQTSVTDIHKVTFGKWKIIGTQLILYDIDDATPIRTFNLKDDAGAPSTTRIFERDPV